MSAWLAIVSVLSAQLAVTRGGALESEAATTSSTARMRVLTDVFGRAIPETKRVLVLPAITVERLSQGKPLDEDRLLAFDDAFSETAGEGFLFRRWQVHAGEIVQHQIARLGFGRRCQKTECIDRLLADVAPTHWISSVIIRSNEHDCRVRILFFELEGSRILQLIEDDIAPCSAANVLARAEHFGRHLSIGPRQPLPIALSLTPLSVASLEIPDIPDVEHYSTSTTSRPETSYPLERALQIYETKHLRSFLAEDGRHYIARGHRLLSDCEALRVASLDVPAKVAAQCEGNLWESAWAGLPLGASMMLASANGLSDGGAAPAVFGIGLGAALLGPALALLLNKDAADPSEHILNADELTALITRANQELRKLLFLTDQDVAIAGYGL